MAADKNQPQSDRNDCRIAHTCLIEFVLGLRRLFVASGVLVVVTL